MKKMLVMEFNELCPSLIDRFMEEGELPNFSKLKASSVVEETFTDAKGEDLNPWVQWVDVHTGLDWHSHGVKRLNSVHNYSGEFTWDILSRQFGVRNWICGSMNAGYSSDFTGKFLPDPWCKDIDVRGENELSVYHRYVSDAVQSHGNGTGISSLSFAKTLLKQRVSLKTIFGLAHQVIMEKLTGKGKWKRAIWLDRIQLDIFKYHYKKESPEFSTFFSNAVAHFQHHYWSDFEPKLFGKKEGNTETKDAIKEAYKNTDFMIGELLKIVDEGTSILFTTALSQEPYLRTERYYYHIRDNSKFFDMFDVPASASLKPIMAEQFILDMPDEESALVLKSNLEAYNMDSGGYFHVGTDQLFLVNVQGNSLTVQCRCTKKVDHGATFHHADFPSELFKFDEMFYEMNEIKTGMHNPTGMYWSRDVKTSNRKEGKPVAPSKVHHDILSFFAS